MSISVTLYHFSKKINSTALPGSAASTTFDCILKDASGIMAPVIGLDFGLNYNPSAYNYAYIEDYHRYYFVKEWVFQERLWWCYLEEDVLATWKAYIAGQSFYVLRSSKIYDGSIADDMYPAKATPIITAAPVTGATPWGGDFSSGYFVISVICSGSPTGTKYYVTNLAGLQALTNVLMADTSWLNVPQDITQGGLDENLLRTLFNPFQYITSIKWYPFKPAVVANSSSSSLKYGWWSITLVGGTVEVLSDSALSGTFPMSFTIPKHPQAALRGDYLNNAPFTRMRLLIEPFGDIIVDPAPFMSESTLYVLVRVDCKTGQAIAEIMDSTNVYATRTVDFGVEIPVSQIAVDKLTQAETLITGAAAVTRDVLHTTATGATAVSNMLNPLAAVSGAMETGASAAQTVITATHAIADGIRCSVPQLETRGMRGSTVGFSITPTLYAEHYELVDEDRDNNGRPYCKEVSPGLIGGYMTVRDGHVNIPGNAGEISAVKAYLEGGFYYE